MGEPLRLGVFGGTFDPIHLGHLRVAESLRELMRLDRVVFVPACVPPHKEAGAEASSEERFDMVSRAVRDDPYFEVSRVEIERTGPSYTVETLAELHRERPEAALFFIAGSDAFRDIRSWKRWEELLDKYSFIVHARPGSRLEAAKRSVPDGMQARIVEIGPRESARPASAPGLYFVEALTLDISATEIRKLCRAGRSIRYLVPVDVEAYIRENRLYGDVR